MKKLSGIRDIEKRLNKLMKEYDFGAMANSILNKAE